MSRDHISEAELERLALREVGRIPDLLICKNEVGRFFKPTLLPALHMALRPFGQDAVRAAIDATQRHRIVVGLGVGSPDLVFSVSGRAGGIELKTDRGVVSEEQARWHAAARRRGMFVAVERSVEGVAAAIERARAGALE